MRTLLLCALALSPAALGGQTKKGAATASIEGDVYYITKTGDVKKGAGQTLLLYAWTPELLSLLSLSCNVRQLSGLKDTTAVPDTRFRGRIARQQLDTVRADVLEHLVEKILSSARLADSLEAEYHRLAGSTPRTLVDSVGTGINAHYQLKAVPPGKYIAYAEMHPLNFDYRWWKVISLQSGDNLKVDLDTPQDCSPLPPLR